MDNFFWECPECFGGCGKTWDKAEPQFKLKQFNPCPDCGGPVMATVTYEDKPIQFKPVAK